MALDVNSLDHGTPRTKDGRTYPSRLKRYEAFDEAFLPVFREASRSVTFDDLIERVDDRRARAAAPSWIDSASWRGLIKPVRPRHGRPMAWRAGPRLHSRRAA